MENKNFKVSNYFITKENEKRVQKFGNTRSMDEIMKNLKDMRKTDIIEIVKEYSDKIKNNRKPIGIAIQVGSETADLMDEVRRSEVPGIDEKAGVDGILGGGCDVIITLLDLLFKKGYTGEDIKNTIKKKCETRYDEMNKKDEEYVEKENSIIISIIDDILNKEYPVFSDNDTSPTLLDSFRNSLSKNTEILNKLSDNTKDINISFPIITHSLNIGDRCIIDFDALTISVDRFVYDFNDFLDFNSPLYNFKITDNSYGNYKRLETINIIHFEDLNKMRDFIKQFKSMKEFLKVIYPTLKDYFDEIYL